MLIKVAMPLFRQTAAGPRARPAVTFGAPLSLAAHIPVLSGGDAVLLLKGPVEAGIVGKAHLFSYLLQQNALRNQGLGGDKPPLGDTAVEAYAHLFSKGMTEGALTDVELPGGILQRDLFAHGEGGRGHVLLRHAVIFDDDVAKLDVAGV